jgi:hypothetical protein
MVFWVTPAKATAANQAYNGEHYKMCSLRYGLLDRINPQQDCHGSSMYIMGMTRAGV